MRASLRARARVDTGCARAQRIPFGPATPAHITASARRHRGVWIIRAYVDVALVPWRTHSARLSRLGAPPQPSPTRPTPATTSTAHQPSKAPDAASSPPTAKYPAAPSCRARLRSLYANTARAVGAVTARHSPRPGISAKKHDDTPPPPPPATPRNHHPQSPTPQTPSPAGYVRNARLLLVLHGQEELELGRQLVF